VFYTDGDAQYDPAELERLYAELTPDCDVVQGWKLERHDAFHRKLIGGLYQRFVRFVFNLNIRDVDCDFRLIRREVLETFPLTCDSGCITVELVARIERAGFVVRELGVHHYPRPYGHSQFFSPRRIGETLWQLAGLWLRLQVSDQPSRMLLPHAGSDGMQL
ncbi:MAG: glycosyltransferase family 2 protein, partial [Chloroflexota bacterium]